MPQGIDANAATCLAILEYRLPRLAWLRTEAAFDSLLLPFLMAPTRAATETKAREEGSMMADTESSQSPKCPDQKRINWQYRPTDASRRKVSRVEAIVDSQSK